VNPVLQLHPPPALQVPWLVHVAAFEQSVHAG
jgi:hypothetical protein